MQVLVLGGCMVKPKKTKKPKKVKGKIKSKKRIVTGYYVADGKTRTLYDDHWSSK